uniref:uncharacterized protein n=1 Tax=Myxine glutinosa TaxID=7769 RepID=UPI00358ED61E
NLFQESASKQIHNDFVELHPTDLQTLLQYNESPQPLYFVYEDTLVNTTIVVLLDDPRSVKLQLMDGCPDVLLYSLLVQSRIHGSINDGRPSGSWGSKAAPYHDTPTTMLHVKCLMQPDNHSAICLQHFSRPVMELPVNKACKNIPSESSALSTVASTDVPSFAKKRLDAPDNSKDKGSQKQNENDASSSPRPRIMFALDSKEGLLDAATSGDYEKFVQLHRDGCNLLSTDEDGCTALHHAATAGHPQLVEFILREAPPELMDMTERHRGETALHRAASNSHPDTCHILIEKGASLVKTDSQGDTALDKAHEAGNHELAAYLEAQQQHQTVTRDDQETAV